MNVAAQSRARQRQPAPGRASSRFEAPQEHEQHEQCSERPRVDAVVGTDAAAARRSLLSPGVGPVRAAAGYRAAPRVAHRAERDFERRLRRAVDRFRQPQLCAWRAGEGPVAEHLVDAEQAAGLERVEHLDLVVEIADLLFGAFVRAVGALFGRGVSPAHGMREPQQPRSLLERESLRLLSACAGRALLLEVAQRAAKCAVARPTDREQPIADRTGASCRPAQQDRDDGGGGGGDNVHGKPPCCAVAPQTPGQPSAPRPLEKSCTWRSGTVPPCAMSRGHLAGARHSARQRLHFTRGSVAGSGGASLGLPELLPGTLHVRPLSSVVGRA